MVLRADDPWWDKHYPRNGWGCTCYVQALSQEDLVRMGLKVSKTPAPMKNLDPYWQHAPGKESHIWPDMPARGSPGKKAKGGAVGEWKLIDNWREDVALQPLPERQNIGKVLPYDSGIKKTSDAERREYAINFVKENILDGEDSKTVSIKYGKSEVPLVISAEGLGGHLMNNPGRLAYLGFLQDLLNPQEMWADFIQWVGPDGKKGKRALRRTLVASIDDPDNEALVLVIQNNGRGQLEPYTFYPARKRNNVAARRGRLIKKYE